MMGLPSLRRSHFCVLELPVPLALPCNQPPLHMI